MNAIQKYFKYRQSLIDQYAKGDMTKREYLQKNYEAVVYGDIGPFRNMDTVEKALFNYQYYNALAKENKTISTTRDMDYELKRDYLEKSNYYYSRKDRATLTALRMLDFRGVVAYFVKVRSRLNMNCVKWVSIILFGCKFHMDMHISMGSLILQAKIQQ